jgi:molybdenum cofactor cytidylyltransferase
LISMNCSIMPLAIIILAAGKSNRLGSPKQLLQYKGKGLLQNAVEAALKTNNNSVIVITGANASLIDIELIDSPVNQVFNENWEDGMASSILCGLTYAESILPDLEAVLFMACDQPFVDGDLLNNIIEKQKETGAPITACVYEEVTGIPAIFHKSIFPELKTLEGDNGAKRIIMNHPDKTVTLSFQQGKIDIDTKADYENLLKAMSN